MASQKRSYDDYNVGWICALPKEQTAATAMLDERHPDLPKPMSDTNTYTLGSIGPHNIVIACLPKGRYGTISAATVATLMICTFPSIKVGLMVGIGGGVPSKVRLGDVVVSSPVGQYPGVVQWDFGKTTAGDGFQRIGALNNPPTSLLTALAKLETDHMLMGSKIPNFLEDLKKYPKLAKYQKSESHQDLLFKADYDHVHSPFMNTAGPSDAVIEISQEEANSGGMELEHGEPCQFCDKSKIIEREERPMEVHYGLIASGNKVIKDGRYREKLDQTLGRNVLCVETEAAGLMNNFPCLVIRGICDYCDSHKNKDWQEHAAAVAAAFAKELLGYIQPADINREQFMRDIMRDVFSQIKKETQPIRDVLDTLRDENEIKKQTETLNWLSPLDFPALQHDYFRRCEPDTGQEFLKSTEVQDWISASKQTLFCQGIPGAGKTFQMAILVNYLVEKYRDDNTVGVAYLYYNFKRQQEQEVDRMIATLIKQLAQNSSPFPEVVHQLRDRHTPMRSRPFLKELSDTLTSLIQSFSRVFILIDALDEGNDSDRTRLLGEIFNLQEKTSLNFFVTSRPINDIAADFKSSISREISPTQHDVFQFLNARMSELPQFVRDDITLQTEVKTAIYSAIGGMFLVAQLYINALAGRRAPASLRATLKDLHQASSSSSSDSSAILNEAYEKSMERIQQLKGDLPRDGLLILSWIVKSRRRMKLTELQEALAVEVGTLKLNEDNIPVVEHIIQACASLVVIEGDTLELVHYTAQEYFERPNNKWMEKAHENIINICITYLSFSVFRDAPCISCEDMDRRIENNHLYSYATKHWAYHANEALEQGLEVSKVIEFLGYGQIRGSWYQDLLYGHTRFDPKFIPTNLTALHVAAFFGMHDVVVGLLEKGEDPDAQDSLLRMPIWWAAWNGHVKVIQPLLEVTTFWETRDVEYGLTTLLAAAMRGYEAIAELLLGKYHINFTSSKGWTSLSLALHHGHKSLAELFIKRGADIEAISSSCQTPLAIAAIEGHLDAVEWLVEKGANIEAQDVRNRTPLMLATIGKHENVVRYLLEKTANMEAMDDRNQTPFTKCFQENLNSMTELFVRNGVNLNIIMSNNYTPLTFAINNGDENIVKFLTENGAHLDSEDGYDMTPLIAAIDRKNKDMIELLIEKGAGLEVKGCSSGDTPLIFATRQNYRDIVKLLIQKGAYLEAQDDVYGSTALNIASFSGFTDIIQLFIENGASVDAENGAGNTALSVAALGGHSKAMQLLLDHNANVETKNNGGATPVSLAAQYGKRRAVQLLIDYNADIETKDDIGHTPLSHATLNGHVTVIQLLIYNNANIETEDNQGMTPLYIAIIAGNATAIQLLLNNNANIEAKSTNGVTPLYIAVITGNITTIQLLLDNNANVDTKDINGLTPFALTVMNKASAPVNLLIFRRPSIAEGFEKYTASGQAAAIGDAAIMQLLLDNNSNIETEDTNGITPLNLATINGYTAAIQLLLNNNANIETKDNRGLTPLSHVAAIGDTAVMQLLLDNNANIESKDNNGSTPLNLAATNGHTGAIQLLLDNNANLEAKDNDGNTPLMTAAAFGHANAVQLLLAFDAERELNNTAEVPSGNKVNAKSLYSPYLYKVTLMHKAIGARQLDIVRILLGFQHVQVDKGDCFGRTPLSYAVETGDESIVKALLDSGRVDVNRRDNRRRTPLFYCASHNVATILLNTDNVDVNSKDNQHRTALWHATEAGDQQLVELLRQHGAQDDPKGEEVFDEDEDAFLTQFRRYRQEALERDQKDRAARERAARERAMIREQAIVREQARLREQARESSKTKDSSKAKGGTKSKDSSSKSRSKRQRG
ncbi:ANK_REP_REGION domain-containing protein [Trichoderma simmonsii]|uniref:ANK_REP_REGION domain-containing protein n=1 Tax=Trichoderma simmonsii TaxID=1491479 RepID=A0A8G0L9B9_9HYPO|nr:ANK_REP_REGION domain-containing protein [Trichoderma simmonsii]